MKYALIGCGRIAVNHIKAVVNNNLDVVALCDIDKSHIDILVEKTDFDLKRKDGSMTLIYDDYKKMLEKNPDIELIAIATDSGVHAEIAKYCIKKNINVIIEKPMAMSMGDCDEIIKLANEHKVKVSVCHQNRFNLAIQEMRKALEHGRFGKISHGSINVRWNRNKDYYDQASWRGKWASDGGCLFNQCIHGIDLLRWMMGDEVEEVYGITKRQFHDYIECEDIGMAVVKFKNGAIGTIEGTVNVFKENLEETLYLFGEKGTCKIGGKSTNNIDFWNFADASENDDKNKNLQEQTSNVYGNGHTSLYADVIDAIKNNRSPYIDSTAGRNAVEMILAIYQSSFTGKPIKLPLTNVSSTDFEGKFN